MQAMSLNFADLLPIQYSNFCLSMEFANLYSDCCYFQNASADAFSSTKQTILHTYRNEINTVNQLQLNYSTNIHLLIPWFMKSFLNITHCSECCIGSLLQYRKSRDKGLFSWPFVLWTRLSCSSLLAVVGHLRLGLYWWL